MIIYIYTYQKLTIQGEIKKNSICKTIKNKIKYLGITFTKEVQDLHTENNKTLLKEILQDLNK